MIHAEFAVAAVALVVTVAVASAQAQTQTASAGPSIWDHNGSVGVFGREWPVSGIPLSKTSCRDVGGRCTSWLSSFPW